MLIQDFVLFFIMQIFIVYTFLQLADISEYHALSLLVGPQQQCVYTTLLGQKQIFCVVIANIL